MTGARETPPDRGGGGRKVKIPKYSRGSAAPPHKPSPAATIPETRAAPAGPGSLPWQAPGAPSCQNPQDPHHRGARTGGALVLSQDQSQAPQHRMHSASRRLCPDLGPLGGQGQRAGGRRHGQQHLEEGVGVHPGAQRACASWTPSSPHVLSAQRPAGVPPAGHPPSGGALRVSGRGRRAGLGLGLPLVAILRHCTTCQPRPSQVGSGAGAQPLLLGSESRPILSATDTGTRDAPARAAALSRPALQSVPCRPQPSAGLRPLGPQTQRGKYPTPEAGPQNTAVLEPVLAQGP
ncbi:PREDICTED: proline-rich protein 2-like [Lipotes vexillifer]|uniref:Proline-rich protein 2-like n=1 Tax=Lipotes vexillifer TaxID=118797 RepID=A0A340WT03_LIPVE|nr:PREDICTED: proline-rich protein 2-like [Lipotes vexillifer]